VKPNVTPDAGTAVSIVVNGAPRTIPPDLTLDGLLRHLDLDPRAVVVEVNREIVRRDALATTPVRDGDQIELVHFVGGG